MSTAPRIVPVITSHYGAKLVISFLNAVLPLTPEQHILTVEYLPTELVPRIPGFKSTIVDFRCTDKQGRLFIVEMQIQWTIGNGMMFYLVLRSR